MPDAGLPPITLPLKFTEPSDGKSVRSAADVEPLNAAEIRTFVVAVTALVPIVKLAAVWPDGTVMLAGMVTGTVPEAPFANAFDSVTVAPPDGAALDNVTVPLAAEPPTTLVGLIATDLRVVPPAGVMSRSADCPGLPGRSAKMFMLN